MGYRFQDYELDQERFELRKAGQPVPIEPQVLSLLLHLVQNRHQLVTRDDLVSAIWNGRIVSDAAISSRIKSARQALNDTGKDRRFIKTIHGKGFRFIADVEAITPATAAQPVSPAEPPQRPSIAVLPFEILGAPGNWALIAEALPHDLITELSRLHWLHVIARGSSFRLASQSTDPHQVGAILGVRYCISGSLEIIGSRMAVFVQLADTRTAAILWAERYEAQVDDVHAIRAHIVASLTAAIELRIPLNEASAARLQSPENLDAWSAYHLGLQHMFRFNAADNALASTLFEHALAREPGFARAHAGLSFTHFQDAFLRYVPDIAPATHAARHHAEQAVALDALDPFVNLAMGRTFWLEGRLENSLGWLERSTTLSPNYAQGVYATAFAQTLLCNGPEGQAHADRAMALSPIDPLHYAMLATRAFSHLVRNETAEAALWADRAARAPGAHVLITMIAAACHAIHGDEPRARKWAAQALNTGALSQQDFFRSFSFTEGPARTQLSDALGRLGF